MFPTKIKDLAKALSLSEEELRERLREMGTLVPPDANELDPSLVTALVATSVQTNDAPLSSTTAEMEQLQASLVQKDAALNRAESKVAEQAEELRQQNMLISEQTRTIRHLQAEARRAEAIDDQTKLQATRLREVTIKARKAEAEVGRLTRSLKKSSTTLEVQKRRQQKLQDQLERTEAQVQQLGGKDSLIERVLPALLKARKRLLPLEVDWIATHGSEPLSSEAINALAKRLGWRQAKAGDRKVELLIVGREGWDPETIERQIAARDGLELRVLSQELLQIAMTAQIDPLLCMKREDLLEHGRMHPALKYLMGAEISWPATFVPSLSTGEWADMELVEQSPLAAMGYRAGREAHANGINDRRRRDILADAFEAELAFVESDEYMKKWGASGRRTRLFRIAQHLSWLAKKGRRDKPFAYKDWTEDLAWLRKTYFRPWMNFRWPGVKVP